jgi:hypothetical protein
VAGFQLTNGWYKNPERHKLGDVDGRAAVAKVFPNAKITSGYRGPNHPLSQKNPDSWHARRRGAIDIAPIPGMTFEQAAQRLRGAGYQILEAGDEVNHPSGHATGPHWHFVLGR